jgi:conjugative relaxase-like TrwC/TraI family protein
MPISIRAFSSSHAVEYHLNEINRKNEAREKYEKDKKEGKLNFEDRQFYYYLNQESGVWYGKGAELLGLSGKNITAEDFRNMTYGKFSYIDNNGKKVEVNLAKHTKDKEHNAGMEIGFDVPKSLSILAEIYGKTEITDALIQATNNTLDYIQNNLMYVRTQENKEAKFEKADNMLVAKFLHNDSREKDPQTHFHALLMNIVIDKYGNVKTAIFNELLNNKRFIQEIFDNEWQHILQELGYTFREVKKVTQIAKELTGITDEQIKNYSKRRNEIERIADERGIDKRDREKMQALTNELRKEKDTSKTLEELREGWRKEEKELVGEERYNEILNDALKKDNKLKNKEQEVIPLNKIIEDSTSHLSERRTTFSKLELISTILQRGKAKYDIREIEKAMTENKEIIHNIVETDSYSKGINTFNTVVRDIYTTKTALATENTIITKITDGRSKFKSIYTKDEIDNLGKDDKNSIDKNDTIVIKDKINSNKIIKIKDIHNTKDKDGNTLVHKIENKYVSNLDKNINILLKQESVSKLTGKEFPNNGESLIDRVGKYYENIGGKVKKNDIGEILLDRVSVKNSVYHGLKNEKVVVLKAIPEIIKNGIIVNKEINWKNRDYNTYLIVAPVTIDKTVQVLYL